MKLMLRRREMMGIAGDDIVLPDGFTRLQYIYNQSNAYIDTGVSLTSSDTIDTQWEELTGHNTGDRMVCGVLPKSFNINLYYSTTRPFMAWGGSGGFQFTSLDQRVRVERGLFYGYNGGAVSITVDKTSFSYAETKPLYLFCWNNGNNVTQYPLKLVGIKYFFVENKCHLIPCTNPDGVVGMYDVINKNFLTSPNGTAFVAGPLYE